MVGSRNNLPLRVQSPVEAPISNEKEGFSLETEGYDSIKSWFRLEINVIGKFKRERMEFLAAYCHIYGISGSHKKLKSDSGFNKTQRKNEHD